MTTHVQRGNADYYLPDPVISGVTVITPTEIKQMVNAMMINHNEITGVAAVFTNPPSYPNRESRLPGISAESQTVYSTVTSYFNGTNPVLSVNNINNFINAFGYLKASTDSLLPSQVGGLESVATKASGDPAVASTINTVRSNMFKFNDYLNGKNSWWDGNNLCARSCQVSCQTGCQLACQGCNNSTCHNQNCGGFS